MINKVFLGIGIALLVFIPIWIFLVVPEMEKLPGDYSREFNLLGTEKPNYEIGGNSEEVLIYNGLKINKWVDKGNNEILADFYFKAETISGEPLFEINKKFDVNRITREIVSGLESEGYLIPPLHLEKKNYNILDSTLFTINNFKYKNIKNINGLETYNYNGKLLNLDSTAGYEFLELVPKTYDAVDDVTTEIWVEPTSGIIVNFEQSGESYYVDKETNEKIHKFTEYTNKFNEDTIANQVRIAQNQKQRIILIEWIVPILLALIGLAFFSAYFISKKHIFTNENTDNTEKKVETKKSSIKTKKPLVTLNENKEEEEK